MPSSAAFLKQLTMSAYAFSRTSFPADASMDRLHQKSYIADARSTATSVVITEEGRVKAEQLFRKLFGTTR
jgi:hypothetical protein